MGRRATAGGVEIRETSLRISFTYRGEVCRETVKLNGKPLAPTQANIKHAMRLSATIRQRIAVGTFDYAEFFPDSPRAPAPEVKVFGELADLWLQSKGSLEDATRSQYNNAVKLWKRLLGADRPLVELTHQVLAAKIGSHPWASGKSANNYLIVLRGVMEFEYRGVKAAQDPMIGIANLPVVRKLPDPLTADERDRVLEHIDKQYDPRVGAYFRFAFYTGVRPEEAIALQWGDLDHSAATARIQRVRTFMGTERDGSKTHSERDIDLVAAAMQAVEAMRPYTSLKSPYVFENPVTRKPWHDERSQRDHYWTPTLRKLRIRYRRPYCTRHTYATVALMNGVNPSYIAQQLGHTNTKMLFDRYARWINGADKGRQKALLEAAFFSQQSPQSISNNANSLITLSEVGRRDWTTNQPDTGKKGNTG